MKKMSVSIDEQETTMNVFPKAAGIPCEIYSSIPSEVTRIKKYAEQYPDEVVITKEDEIGIFATAPAKWFKFTPPRRGKVLTEEEKAELRERMASIGKSNRRS